MACNQVEQGLRTLSHIEAQFEQETHKSSHHGLQPQRPSPESKLLISCPTPLVSQSFTVLVAEKERGT